MSEVHDVSFYLQCMAGGTLACAVSRTTFVPLDIVKCRRQIDPKIYRGLLDGLLKIGSKEGLRGLSLGWSPTCIGYGMQGLGKFGFYEIFKDLYKYAFHPQTAQRYQMLGWCLAGASAEFIADFFLCPMEAIKVRMQTSNPGTFPTSLLQAFRTIQQNEGINGFYKGLGPLWARQVPYTASKFVAFENMVHLIYSSLLPKPKEQYSKSTQLLVTFASGYIGGMVGAFVSHPADTMVSQYNNRKTEGSMTKNIALIYREIGFKGLWRGLASRLNILGALVGTISMQSVAYQFWIYDTFKTVVGLNTAGHSNKA